MGEVAICLVPLYHTFCQGVERPYCLNYMNASGELAVTRFTYSKGRNDRAFYQDITGGRSSRNIHEFDKAGRLVRKYREYNDGETSTELFTYDASGRLIEESFSNSGGTTGTAHYAYDALGRACQMACHGYKGWLHGDLHFTFDAAGKRLAGSLTRDGQPAGRITYDYDPSGNLVREHWELTSGWTQTFCTVYEPA